MRRRRSQQGYLVMFVGVLGSIATLGTVLLFQGTSLMEQRAIEENLAQSRAYWAAMGAFNYVLSRANQDGACACDFDTTTCPNPSGQCSSDLDRVYTFSVFRDELGTPYSLEHEYLDGDYTMNVTLDIQNDEDGSSSDNGHLKMVATISSVGTHRFLSSIADRLHVWEMGFCIDTGGANCPAVTDDLAPTETTGLTHIKYVRRQ